MFFPMIPSVIRPEFLRPIFKFAKKSRLATEAVLFTNMAYKKRTLVNFCIYYRGSGDDYLSARYLKRPMNTCKRTIFETSEYLYRNAQLYGLLELLGNQPVSIESPSWEAIFKEKRWNKFNNIKMKLEGVTKISSTKELTFPYYKYIASKQCERDNLEIIRFYIKYKLKNIDTNKVTNNNELFYVYNCKTRDIEKESWI
jgi:hypothetical protein